MNNRQKINANVLKNTFMNPHILQSATLHTFQNENVYDHVPKDLK